MQPRVSVIIPTFNRRKFICDAVESVLRQRDCTQLEVIVVDDGSTDDTSAVLKPYESAIRYIYQDNVGVSAARNLGIREARGHIVGFLDSDDVWAPGKLAAQLGRVTGTAMVSFAGVKWFVDRPTDEALLRQTATVRWPRCNASGTVLDPMLDIAEGRYLHVGSLLCAKEVFSRVGGFDETMCMGEDEDWFSRASLLLHFNYLPLPLLRRRFHANQTDAASEVSIRSLIKVLERMADRTTAVHPAAHKAAKRRLAAQWSHMANILRNQDRRHEAICAAQTAFRLNPTNLKRLAKVALYSF